MDRDEMSNLYRRRRLKCEKLTDDRRRTPSDGKSSHCLWQGELKRTTGFLTIFQLFHEGHFIGGVNRSTLRKRKPMTHLKSLTNFIT